MTSSQNSKALVQGLTQAFNARDRARFETFYTDHIVVHEREGALTLHRENLWEFVSPIFEGFPNLMATIETMVAEETQIVVRWTYAGTHTGAFRGIEPTGRPVEWAHTTHYWIENDRIVAGQPLSDALHLYAQLGVIQLPTGGAKTYV